jgi:tetratricopeptide (TPR) repeat protein
MKKLFTNISKLYFRKYKISNIFKMGLEKYEMGINIGDYKQSLIMLKGSLKYFRKELKIRPENLNAQKFIKKIYAEFYYQKGIDLYKNGFGLSDSKKSYEFFKKAVLNNPDHNLAKRKIDMFLYEKGEFN